MADEAAWMNSSLTERSGGVLRGVQLGASAAAEAVAQLGQVVGGSVANPLVVQEGAAAPVVLRVVAPVVLRVVAPVVLRVVAPVVLRVVAPVVFQPVASVEVPGAALQCQLSA